jgi:hypothetical protein
MKDAAQVSGSAHTGAAAEAEGGDVEVDKAGDPSSTRAAAVEDGVWRLVDDLVFGEAGPMA